MFVLALTTLLVAPWHGKDLPTASYAAAKYRLTVRDVPGSTVQLRATHVAPGWIAAFCDTRVCSPGHVAETIPASGSVMLQFELIREEDRAPHSSGATIVPDRGAAVVIEPLSGGY